MNAIESWETEGGALPHHRVAASGAISLSLTGTSMMASRYPRFRNDRAVPEIRIGAREFNCIGVSPPQDHPHVYINMGDQETILCPYCATRYRYDSRLAPFEADPQDCLFVDPGGV
jgi:uncharacterized Zn-finger protein